MEDSISREVRVISDSDIKNITVPFSTNHPSRQMSNIEYDWIPLTFLNLVVQSGFIPKSKPLSTLLVAHAGLGKTIKLETLRQFDFVKYTLDITPKIIAEFLNDVQDGKKMFLVIPDYIATLSHSKRTVELARSIFRAMMEEGVTDVDIFGMVCHFKTKIRAGLISGITPEYYNENTRVWKSDGFLQRFIPFSYSHKPSTTNSVLDNIKNNIDTVSTFDMKIRTKDVYTPVRKEEIDDKIRLIMYSILEPKEPPYRLYLQLISLCNASAILRDSKEVTTIDTDLVKLFANYINRGQTPI